MRKNALSRVVPFSLCLCAAAVLACQDGGRGPTDPGPLVVSAQTSTAQAATVAPRETGDRAGLRGERPGLAGERAAALAERAGSGVRPVAAPAPQSPAAALDDTKRNGNGGNGGNGNGGNGNGGHGGGRGGNGGGSATFDPARASLQIAPDHWNVNYEHAAGAVTAFVRGDNLRLIDRSTVELLGDDPAAAPLPARSARVEGKHLRAQFPKADVLDLLADPTPGTTHTVRLRFMAEGVSAPVELSAEIVVVGPADGGGETPGEISLNLRLQPDAWSTNYGRSAGTVVAKISGAGFRKIDLDSIVLVGTNAEAGELAPRRVQRVGNHVQAFFGKKEAYSTLMDPAPGQVHTVTLKFTVEGAAQELTAEVHVVGPAR